MNSYLIIGATYQERLQKVKFVIENYKLKIVNWENHPDLLVIQPDPSVRIRHIREVQQFLSLKPYQGEIKAVVISEAEKMTIPAQNAFLKTLEEPPAHSLIILSCQNEDQVLATIISRCQIIKINSKYQIPIDQKQINNYQLLITNLSKAKVGERLKLIEPYEKTRDEAIKFCQEMIIILREMLIKQNSPLDNSQLIIMIKSFQQSLNFLQANVNVKLVLDNLVINL